MKCSGKLLPIITRSNHIRLLREQSAGLKPTYWWIILIAAASTQHAPSPSQHSPVLEETLKSESHFNLLNHRAWLTWTSHVQSLIQSLQAFVVNIIIIHISQMEKKTEVHTLTWQVIRVTCLELLRKLRWIKAAGIVPYVSHQSLLTTKPRLTEPRLRRHKSKSVTTEKQVNVQTTSIHSLISSVRNMNCCQLSSA